MGLSTDLISQFVKATKDTEPTKTENTVYGTIVYNEKPYVKLDGSDLLTPVSITANVSDGERVTVSIQNHTATVTGNISSPSASSSDVQDIVDEISEFEIVIADKVSTKDLDAEKARIDTLISDNVTIKQTLTANEADISNLKAENATITGKLTATEADITKLQTEKLNADIADITYATITDLEATNADIHNLEATYGEFEVLTTNKFAAIDATIQDLDVDNLNAKYANIDFSNIGEAAIKNFYSTSGIIENLVISEGTITGNLVGVTIKGDLIEGGTVVADKLVVKGEDGLYYKLNTDGVTTEAEQTEYNSLNGSIITAKSITATKISVDDLVAFDATIGGFNITENSIYSGVKTAVDNTTRGVYFDNEGQASFGDSSNYIKYYRDVDGNYKLELSASTMIFSSSNKNVETVVNEAQTSANNAQNAADEAQTTASDTEARLTIAESTILKLSDSISMLVTDGNGSSLMTQTENGWTFSISELQDSVDNASKNLDTLTQEIGNVNATVDVLQQAVNDLGETAEYVKIKVYEDEPCIELGESDSDFKILITNTRIMFMEGSNTPTYISNKGLVTENIEVENELRQGGWVWKVRSNGNVGLIWKGVSE